MNDHERVIVYFTFVTVVTQNSLPNGVHALTFLNLVKQCANLDSANGLQAFVELRNLSWDIPPDQQANIIHDRLKKAVHNKKGSPLYTLCAVEMLLRHGGAGLLDELMNPENLHKLAEYFPPGRRPPKVEIQQLLARHIKVSPLFESAFLLI